ncbi:uncharacterized protein LMH87_008675 [Akanthomyces muscarius]|uniref:F-box domain-containing protein n=1 Tax=Akanthomyces muscarius TaxID=2231603 RepID=A0A9W8UPW1_AKAMU|nr:uncharacterized protein LMH87_008675 [Akanthomyces muscarius]KAJ4158136.1 hypothetical protein LMH87_008675 [Akanthomyces muscarius]
MSSPEIDTWTGLPPEIKTSICQYLDNKDLKALRLTNSSFSASVTLRLPRVYLSLHPRDIAVFKAIADHPLRQQVTEIVYDDARLPRLFPLSAEEQEQRRVNPLNNEDETEEYDEINRLNEVSHGEGGMPICPVEKWYCERLEETADDARRRYSKMSPKRYPVVTERALKTAARPDAKVSLGLYQKLYKEQVKTAEVDADIEALRYGIGRFPALKRITITPAAHGALYSPRYHTPTIRSLPFGLNYVLPRGWPYRDGNFVHYTPAWPRAPMQSLAAEEHRMLWRGVVSILQVLAQQPHLVPPELVFDVHGLNTGLNPHMLGQPSVDYDNLATVLQRGLRRLDLPIIIGGLEDEGWDPLINGNFRSLLEKAPGLEHFRLRADASDNESSFPPLQSMLPVETWKNLRHFGISEFVVDVDDLTSTLALLPKSLRSVELTFLSFVGVNGHYRALFDAMKTRLDWPSWPSGQRPTVIAALPDYLFHPESTCGIWISDAVNEFLYGDDGENPIQWGDNRVHYGVGTMKDELDCDWELPNLQRQDLFRLGHYSE